MSLDTPNEPVRGYLFTVDILIENETNGRALERLLRLLNDPEIKDYRIKQGIELGKWIEIALEAEKAEASRQESKKKAAAAASGQNPYSPLVSEIERHKASNSLVRLIVMKGKGVKLSLPCRILNYDPATQNVSIYHVDEKKVYLFRLNEIDDLQAD